MLQHINRLKSLHEQLKEMGAAIDDQELAMTLLSSLPEEFKPLITALDAVGEDNITFEKVKGMLLNDIDRNRDIGQPKSSEIALFVKKGGGFKKGPRRHDRTGSTPAKIFRGTYHFCKEQGHFARDCPRKKNKDCGYDNRKTTIFVGYPAGTKGYKLFDISTGDFVRSRDVVFAEEDFHDFVNERSANTDFFYPKTLINQSESAEEGNQPEPDTLINQPVGETYEDRFMQEVQQLGPLRKRKAPRRLIEECNVVSLTSDIDEPGTINEAWEGNFKRQ